jgi:hypothetical protein
MGKVPVRILKPFGDFSKGEEVEIEESRLSFLSSRKMVVQIDSITPPTPVKEEDSIEEELEEFKEELESVFEQFEILADQLDFKYEPGPKASVLMAKLSEFLALEPGSEPDSKEDTSLDMDPFEIFLLERLDQPVVTNTLKLYKTAQEIMSKSEEELDKIELVGPATARAIKKAAEEYLNKG